jgi:putative membrane protein
VTSARHVLLAWTFPPASVIGLLILAGGYLEGVRLVSRGGGPPNPGRRTACFLAGVGVLALSLLSPIDTYAERLLSVHMVQHILITMVAAPLLLIGGPVTLILRSATPRGRRRFLRPALRSRVAQTLGNPVLTWTGFAGVMWGTHFTGLYELALERQSVHALEHLVYLAAALLFWWPVLRVDPSPARLPYAGRILYLFAAMPVTAFLGLAIYGSDRVLYPHYLVASARLGISALADQHLAGAIMWVSAMVVMLPALARVLFEWLDREDRLGVRAMEGSAPR